jgi:hypothetical protein
MYQLVPSLKQQLMNYLEPVVPSSAFLARDNGNDWLPKEAFVISSVATVKVSIVDVIVPGLQDRFRE